MKEIIDELNNEICPHHLKQPRCKVTNEGIEYNACCIEFTTLLNAKLTEINNRIAQKKNDSK